MIKLEGVGRNFETEGRVLEALKNVSLEIDKGKICGIIGFSGAGKSTLVRCINLLERPTVGKVFIEGTDITALSEKALRLKRKEIGMIFQQFNLFASRNVYENVAYPLKHSKLKKEEIKKKVDELLDLVGISDKAAAYPSQLSGGQKQRVAIARALANNPKILLSDESTSALDPQTTKSILKLLKKLNTELGITIVIITHEMQVVKEICDRVAVMENGEIVEEGDVFKVFTNPKKQITKDFVDSTSNISKIHELIEDNSSITKLSEDECIVKFKYLEKSASKALVSYVSREFDLNINIVFGNIELIGENPIGSLVSIVKGSTEDIDKAISYLKEKDVEVEVILDGRAS